MDGPSKLGKLGRKRDGVNNSQDPGTPKKCCGDLETNKHRREILKSAVAVASLGSFSSLGSAEDISEQINETTSEIADTQPNIVQILVDDLGWADLGCYGSDFHESPNIDQLAEDGTRFTNAYAASPICSPTRASLMTGQSPPRHGITQYIGAGVTEGGETSPVPGESLSPGTPTTASLLSDAGYHTVHLGKWHLTNGNENVGPTDVGFDQNIGGSHWGLPANGYFCPFGSGIPNLSCSGDDYLPDRLTDEAVNIFNNTSGPVFMNLAFYSVHIPIQARDEDIQYFQDKRDQMNLPSDFESGDKFPLTKKQNGSISRRTIQSDPEYAAMIYRMDYNVGRLLDAIEASDRPTIVLFHSDNGGLSTAEGSPTYNDPLSEGKGWGYDGGIRVPTIVRWPGVTDGEVNDALVTTEDLYVTALKAAGVSIPSDHTVDGRDLHPILTGTNSDRNELYWHYPHYSNQGGTPVGAIRYGDYKLLEFYEDEHVELYNVASDPGERIDLSAALPNATEQLRDRLNEWQSDVDAEMPTENDIDLWPDRKPPGRSYEWKPGNVPRYTPDESGESNTGTIVGNGTQTAGRDGSDGFRFDGSTSVDLPSSNSLEIVNAPLTIECWVKPGDPKSGRQGFEPYVTQGESIMLHRAAQDAPAEGGVGVVLQTADGTYHTPHASVPSDWQGTWHHLALVWDGNDLQFYLDGQQAATESCSGALKPELDHFAVGANLEREMQDRFVSDGTVIDSVRIYRRALSQSELGANAASTSPTDSSTVLWLDFEQITPGETPLIVRPTDPDGDGLFEDLDGDGNVTVADVQMYAENIDDSTLQTRVDDFDYNANGRIDHDDLIELFEEVTQ